MKNKIEIDEINISKYNKRVQKIISEHTGEKISLNEASELLAKILGCSSSFELNSILKKDIIKEFKEKLSNKKLSGIEKIKIILIQIQKMMKETKIEFWYAVFCKEYAGNSNHYGKPDFNGIEVLADFIGFTNFSYDPKPEDDYWLSINETLESLCIQYGLVDEDIKRVKSSSIKKHENEKDQFWIDYHKSKEIRLDIYTSKSETRKIKEIAEFSQEFLWDLVNETKSDSDFWLVEKNRIIIQHGKKNIIIP